jgi:ketosteroid isomerase-like protein
VVDDDGAEARALHEVQLAFADYEQALLANDIETMDRWFWDDPAVVRFGIAECQYGPDEIAAWRRTTAPVPADRRHVRTSFTAHGPDLVVATLEFANGASPGVGRQSQVWRRTENGWRVVHAHVSMID